MRIPRGDLLRSRVVDDPGTTLSTALDRRLTGYAVFEPQDAVLLDDETRGVLTFEAGIPTLAYCTDTDRGGADALNDLAGPGPYSVDLYELDRTDLAEAHGADDLRVPPGLPAERLTADRDLVTRTREAAPDERLGDDADAVATFLEDEAGIEAIREQARAEARARAEEWGLTDALDD
ncbi:hypothetical protein EI982_09805 [Haloplanus rallus]|jgi:hypothetical protein|uniref:DUF8054 domain-containing protein n=1 Tax=Haloplanus rallus TaxID=1816183 RepID=A0A6B9FG76_9EURY|nr:MULTISPECIES: hypothetical protein [Haloplanus]QGX95063.1 hypothetical protein EI982_09805 [Haloplanus rallus]